MYVSEFLKALMRFEKNNLGYLITFMLVGAILGSALGTLLAGFVPALSVIQKSLTGPIGFNLEIISFSIKINLSSIVGLVIGILIFMKV
jgi:hypothetical protein